MLTLWRNTRIATCNERADVHSAGAVFTRDGMIEWVGDETELPAGLRPERTVELAGRWLTPGLIDCHTHLVFAGQRSAEFARRTSGTSYAEIAREGGGILGTMRATRAATEEALFEQSRPRLESLLQEGVTTVEIKSGYGLELEAEKKMLRVARRLGAGHPVTISTSFLAAHALPPEFSGRPDEYIDTICRDWLPDVAAGLADSVDAFCEDIGFSAAQCDRLFTAARQLGLPVRLHAEQLSNVGGSQVAARHDALSCDHLEYANEQDAAALARSGTVAVMLPVAFYTLAENAAAADRGVARAARADGRRVRLQSGLGTVRLAAARDQHGPPPVRTDERRGPAGRHAPRRARAGHGRGARGHRARARCGLRGMVHRIPGRARLLDRLQSVQHGRQGRRDRARAPGVKDSSSRGRRPRAVEETAGRSS